MPRADPAAPARPVVRGAAPGPAGQAPAGRPERPAAAGAALAPGRGRRGGAGRRRGPPGAAGARRAATRCTSATPPRCGPTPDADAEPRLRRAGPHPRHASRCAPRPTPGRCSTGCSSCGCPTSSPSTPTSSSACSTTGVAALRERGRRRALAAQPGPRPEPPQRVDARPASPASHSRGAAHERLLRAGGALRLQVAARAARRPAHRRRRWTSWRRGDRRSSSCAATGPSSTPPIVRKARKRLIRTVTPAAGASPPR